jgi:hypothetical protein
MGQNHIKALAHLRAHQTAKVLQQWLCCEFSAIAWYYAAVKTLTQK